MARHSRRVIGRVGRLTAVEDGVARLHDAALQQRVRLPRLREGLAVTPTMGHPPRTTPHRQILLLLPSRRTSLLNGLRGPHSATSSHSPEPEEVGDALCPSRRWRNLRHIRNQKAMFSLPLRRHFRSGHTQAPALELKHMHATRPTFGSSMLPPVGVVLESVLMCIASTKRVAPAACRWRGATGRLW